jgi:hypothetical protein
MSRWFRAGAAGLLAVALAAGGCRPSGMPRTYPAGGKVVYAGGRPVKGGSIQLTSAADPSLRVVGTIGEDGRFTLSTVKDKDTAAGAPEGEYQVIVFPPLTGDHKGAPPMPVSRPCKVEARDNDLQIELNAPPPRP